MSVRTINWTTVVEIHRLDDQVDLGQVFNEALIAWHSSGGNMLDQSPVVFGPETPQLTALKAHLDRLALAYLKQHWQVELPPEALYSQAWLRYTHEDRDLDIHNHNGAHLTGVFYIEASDGDLVLADPRHGAGRGYPTAITETQFSNFHYHPRSGEFVLFPSYVYHHALMSPTALRMAMPIDFFIRRGAV